MRPLTLASLLFASAALPAQTLVAAGDAHVNLSHLLHFHPEGLLLSLPGPGGPSLAEPLEALLGQEALAELQLTHQGLSSDLPAGKQLQRLQGWGPELPHWALVGPGPRVYAEGTGTPTPRQLREAYEQSGLRTRVARLREFQKEHPGHTDGLARLLLEVRSIAERRTELRLGPALGAEAAAREPQAPQNGAPGGKEMEGGSPKGPGPTLLGEEEDSLIWGEYADLYERFITEGHWLNAGGETGPLPVAAPLSGLAEHSPLLRALAARLRPEVEAQLKHRLTDERRWQVWLSLRRTGSGGRPSELLLGVPPLPGSRRWPPPAAVDAFVEDAQRSGDWREAEPVLQSAFDQAQELLRAMESAAREDAGAGSSGGPPKVQLGTYFGFGGWTGEVALLVEAKLRLGKLQEADQLVQAVYGRVTRGKTLDQAVALARSCGVPSLAEKWERMRR